MRFCVHFFWHNDTEQRNNERKMRIERVSLTTTHLQMWGRHWAITMALLSLCIMTTKCYIRIFRQYITQQHQQHKLYMRMSGSNDTEIRRIWTIHNMCMCRISKQQQQQHKGISTVERSQRFGIYGITHHTTCVRVCECPGITWNVFSNIKLSHTWTQ